MHGFGLKPHFSARLLNIGIGRSDGFTECEIFGHLMDEIEKFWI